MTDPAPQCATKDCTRPANDYWCDECRAAYREELERIACSEARKRKEMNRTMGWTTDNVHEDPEEVLGPETVL